MPVQKLKGLKSYLPALALQEALKEPLKETWGSKNLPLLRVLPFYPLFQGS